ncbi:MAG: hypothetical protein JWO99_82 [Candidatus Saccharibacteria bacterium]|nr:hypothetical protein [Candidatus Saccharibacteria bacterium]
MIKKILEGIHDMVEGLDYLNDSEKELLERRSEFERADAIQSIAALAARIDSLRLTAESLRTADPEVARKVGKKVRKITKLLGKINPVESVEPVPVATDEPPEEPVVPVEAPATLTIVPDIEEESIVETSAEVLNEGVSPAGLKWLVKGLGEDWATRLDLPLNASATMIAAAIVQFAPPRKPNTVEFATKRILARLEGKTNEEIAGLTDGDTPTATHQYLYMTLKRITKDTSGAVRLAPAEQQPAEDEAPVVTVAEVVEVPTVPAPAVETEGIPLTHVEVGTLIGEKLKLSGQQIMGLRSFLDAKSKSDMTTSKEDALKQVRKEIRDKIEDPLYGLTRDEKRWIRESFGVYHFRDQAQDRDPVSVNQLAGSRRLPNQKSGIPEHIYSGLEKLFSDPNVTAHQVDSFIQAALSLESMTDEVFHEQRAELFSNLERDGILTKEQTKALSRRAQFGEKNEYMISDHTLKQALRVIEHHVVEAGGVNSGSSLIDGELKKFISPIAMTSHLDALRSQLPEKLRGNPQYIERIIAAGIQAVYKQINERAA